MTIEQQIQELETQITHKNDELKIFYAKIDELRKQARSKTNEKILAKLAKLPAVTHTHKVVLEVTIEESLKNNFDVHCDSPIDFYTSVNVLSTDSSTPLKKHIVKEIVQVIKDCIECDFAFFSKASESHDNKCMKIMGY